MTTVFARFGGGQIADEVTSTVPTLAALMDRIGERQPWAVQDELPVDAETFARAEKEMKSVRAKRGYSDLPRADLPQKNFLLFGVPVVCED